MPRNPLDDENQNHETIKGEDIINARTERVVRIRAQDGTFQDVLLNAHETRPDGNGNFVTSEFINVVTDHAGNPLPENPRSVFVSKPSSNAVCPAAVAINCEPVIVPDVTMLPLSSIVTDEFCIVLPPVK